MTAGWLAGWQHRCLPRYEDSMEGSPTDRTGNAYSASAAAAARIKATNQNLSYQGFSARHKGWAEQKKWSVFGCCWCFWVAKNNSYSRLLLTLNVAAAAGHMLFGGFSSNQSPASGEANQAGRRLKNGHILRPVLPNVLQPTHQGRTRPEFKN